MTRQEQPGAGWTRCFLFVFALSFGACISPNSRDGARLAADGGVPDGAPAAVDSGSDPPAAGRDGPLVRDVAPGQADTGPGQAGDAPSSSTDRDGPRGPAADAGAPDVALAPGAVIWTQTLAGIPSAVAVDQDNNIVVSAITNLGAASDTGLGKYTQDGTLIWLKEFGGQGAQIVDAMTLASDGSPLITGEFTGMTNFGGQSRTTLGDQNRDVFLAAYDPGGILTTVLTFGGPGPEAGNGVLVDRASGDWFLSGWGGPFMAGAQTVTDNFLIRVSPAGQVRWALDAGRVLFSLPNDGDLISGGDVVGRQLSRHTRAGAAVWVKDLGPNLSIDKIAVDPSGNLVTGISFRASISLGNQILTSQGLRDVALAALSSATGEVLWAKPLLGSAGDDVVLAVCVDAAGDILVAGSYAGSPTFQPGEAAAMFPLGYVARYSSDGTRRWIQPLAFAGGYVLDLVCNAPGGLIIAYSGGFAKLAP